VSKDFTPYILGAFRPPPSLEESLKRASPGSCEHPSQLREPKNPTLTGAPPTSVSVPGTGNRGGTNLTLAFKDFDDRNREFEADRIRWLEHNLSPSRGVNPSTGSGGGPALQIVSDTPSTLTVSPSTAQVQGTDTLVWHLSVSAAATGAYYA